jgi:hypothetical protein
MCHWKVCLYPGGIHRNSFALCDILSSFLSNDVKWIVEMTILPLSGDNYLEHLQQIM